MQARLPRARLCAATAAALALCAAPLCAPSVASAQPTQPNAPITAPVEAGVAPGEPLSDTRPGEAFADPKVARLQRTAADVQRELGDLAGRIHTAEDESLKATEQLNRVRAEREQADRAVAAQQGEVDAYSAAVYSAMSRPSELRALVTATDPADFLAKSELVGRLRADQDGRLAAALARQRAAVDAERTATDAERAAVDRKVELDRRDDDASNRAAAVSSELRGFLADTNAAVVAQQQGQQRRNADTAANWRAYTDKLAAAIRPPPAAALRDPARLPAGLQPLPGSAGPQPGVAQVGLPSGERLLVLPEETVAAVTAAVGALGKPYVPQTGGMGPSAYSCDGLVHAAYAGAGLPVPATAADQFAALTPVPPADAQPGDLAFLGPARYGVQSVAVLLDQHTMLAADARLAGVVVTDLPAGDSLLGIARPALPVRAARPVPRSSAGGLPWRCGGVELPPRASGEAAGGWGGYPNGFIPPAALCGTGVGSHALRCDAAAAFQALSAAFSATFGRQLCVTDSYRTFDAQLRLYALKPALAAVPGTSNHGWGLAVDLCGGVEAFGTPEYAWLARSAPAFGWANPAWAWPGRGRVEPWHWEFFGAGR
ncbi:MAG: D-alanyl-D-alanine carboxypeptidase family protein [Labedaea sp.]